MGDNTRRMKMEAYFGVDMNSLHGLVRELDNLDKKFAEIASDFPEHVRGKVRQAMGIIAEEQAQAQRDHGRALAENERMDADAEKKYLAHKERYYAAMAREAQQEESALRRSTLLHARANAENEAIDLAHEKRFQELKAAHLKKDADQALLNMKVLANIQIASGKESDEIEGRFNEMHARRLNERLAMREREARAEAGIKDKTWKESDSDMQRMLIARGAPHGGAEAAGGSAWGGRAAGFGGGMASGMASGPFGALAFAANPWVGAGMMAGQGASAMYDKGVEARQWDFKIKQLSLYMGDASLKGRELEDVVSRLAIGMGKSIPEAADAMREAVSMAVRPENAAAFVRVAQSMAMIQGQDVGTSTHVLAGIKNAFGMGDKEFQKVPDILNAAREKANLHVEPGQLGGLDVLASESGASFEDMITAMSAMSVKDVKSDRGVAALRQVMTKAMYPTAGQSKAQDQAGFHFDKESIETYGFIGALQKLDEALKKTGVSIREALGVESNRGTIVAIEAMLDRVTTARLQAELLNSKGLTALQGRELRGTAQFESEQRGELWSQKMAGVGGFFSNIGASISEGASLATSPAYRREKSRQQAFRGLRDEFGVDDLTDEQMDTIVDKNRSSHGSRSQLGKALKDEQNRLFSEEHDDHLEKGRKVVQDRIDDRKHQAHEDWLIFSKTLDRVEKQLDSIGNKNLSHLQSALDKASSLSLTWQEHLVRLKDQIELGDEKMSDRLAKRGQDYSTRTKQGTVLSTYMQARSALGQVGAAGAAGDLGRFQKESGRFAGFMGDLRGMDLASIAKQGFNQRDLDQYIDQTIDAEGVTGPQGRSQRRHEITQQARDFERDVRKKYGKFSSRPDLHKDADFSKWYADTAQDRESKSERGTEQGMYEEAKGFQAAAKDQAAMYTEELERQKKLIAEQAVEWRNVKENIPQIVDPQEREVARKAAMSHINALGAEIGTVENTAKFAAEAKGIPSPTSLPAFRMERQNSQSTVIEKKSDVHVKITLAPGTTDAQAKELAQKLGPHLRTEMDRGRIILTNNE